LKTGTGRGQVIYGIDGRTRFALGPLDDRALFERGANLDQVLAASVRVMKGTIQPQELGSLPIVDLELISALFCIENFGDVIGHNITCKSCRKKYGVEFSLSTYVSLLTAEITPHAVPDFRGYPLTLPTRDMISSADSDPARLARAVWHNAGPFQAHELQALETYLEKTCPVLQEEIGGPCPACQTAQTFRFVLRDWVTRKLNIRLKQTLMQVHLLAATYSWRLEDIFALNWANRLTLIDTIRSDATRRGGRRFTVSTQQT
jgi:hypothetical protein